MEIGNQTSLNQCKFLNGDYFMQLYETFIDAFSDYVISFALTETQFRKHIRLNAVDLERTVGFFDNGRLVGFSLNGFGQWEGLKTVYDAGTGVVPDHRRQGISNAMFELMLTQFNKSGIEQFLLEVVTTNSGAVKLYEKHGFTTVRHLALLQCDDSKTTGKEPPSNIEIREIDAPDWDLFKTFWDGRPSWQNSIEAIERSLPLKTILGAFVDSKCVGYIIFSSKFGRVAQFGVNKDYRNRGVGTALVRALKAATADGYSMQVINIDKSLTEAMQFFLNRGFYERLGQFEMTCPISAI